MHKEQNKYINLKISDFLCDSRNIMRKKNN